MEYVRVHKKSLGADQKIADIIKLMSIGFVDLMEWRHRILIEKLDL